MARRAVSELSIRSCRRRCASGTEAANPTSAVRIKKAEEGKSVELDLSNLHDLTRFPPELANLTSLQLLNLYACKQLSGDLSPLAELTSLQELNLSGCLGIRRFSPLESLRPTLHKLYLAGCKFEYLPPEVCGENFIDNVLDKVRAHYKDLKAGQRTDAEVRVLFLGNGGTGKTRYGQATDRNRRMAGNR